MLVLVRRLPCPGDLISAVSSSSLCLLFLDSSSSADVSMSMPWLESEVEGCTLGVGGVILIAMDKNLLISL